MIGSLVGGSHSIELLLEEFVDISSNEGDSNVYLIRGLTLISPPHS